MRGSKVINIEGRGEVTVKEVSAWGVHTAWRAEDRLAELKTLIDDAVQPGFDVIKTWYPSEQEAVLSALLEVNKAFFGMARTLRVDGLLEGIVTQLASSLPDVFAALFRQGISAQVNTDGSFS